MANCRLSWFSRWVRTKMQHKLNRGENIRTHFKRLDEEMPFPNLCLFWAPSAVLRFFLLKIWKQPQKPTWNPINDDWKWMSFLFPTDLSDKTHQNVPKPAWPSITALLGKPSQPSEVFVTSTRFGPFSRYFCIWLITTISLSFVADSMAVWQNLIVIGKFGLGLSLVTANAVLKTLSWTGCRRDDIQSGRGKYLRRCFKRF